jgi:hypothetical protein
MTFQPKKLSLVGIALLVASIALIFLSKLAVNQVAFNLFLMSSFTDVAALNMYTLLFAVAGYVLMAAGAALFVYVAWRSRFVVDAPTVKRQLRVLIVAVAVLLVTLSLFCTQVASANSLATTGYYLATPYSPYDWLIGKFSTGTTYAINGSNWANMMTWPTPAPWADYAGNSSAVIEAALAASTAGTVYLKEVAFDYDCTIPANVQVIENLNGLTRVFVDDSESQGSPYTVSVDTVNPTFYTVQDCADRYIISWTSTNASYVFNSALATNNKVHVKDGIYTIKTTICPSNGSSLIGESWNTKLVRDASLADSIIAVGRNIGSYASTSNVTISNIELDGNKAAGGVEAGDIVKCKGVYAVSFGASRTWANMSLMGFNNVFDKIYAHDCFAEGLSTDYQVNMTLSDCIASNNNWGDIAFYATTKSSMINCRTYNGELSGFNCEGLINSTIINCMSYGHSEYAGIDLVQTNADYPVTGNVISGFISDGDKYGILLIGYSATSTANYNTFSDINTVNSVLNGIYTSYADNNAFSNINMKKTGEYSFYLLNSHINNIAGLTILGSLNYSLVLSGSNYNTISGVNIVNSTSNSIYLSYSNSNAFSAIDITNSTSHAFATTHADYNTFSSLNVRTTGFYGFYMLYSNGNEFSSFNIIGTAQTGIALIASQQNSFSTGRITNCSLAWTNNYNGINLSAASGVNSTKNIFTGVTQDYTGTVTTAKGYNEADIGQDYNVVTSCAFLGETTGATTLGANSQFHLSYNGTSWVS